MEERNTSTTSYLRSCLPTIPIPAEFLDASIEVLFLRLNEMDSIQRMPAGGASARMKKILSAEPAQLSSLSKFVAVTHRKFRQPLDEPTVDGSSQEPLAEMLDRLNARFR